MIEDKLQTYLKCQKNGKFEIMDLKVCSCVARHNLLNELIINPNVSAVMGAEQPNEKLR